MKTRLKKIALIVAGLLLVSVAAVLILAKVLITEERVRATVVPLVEKNLHRTLQLGTIDISLFSGIRLEDVVLYDADGQTEFVAADAIELHYRLLPLLLLRVEIDRVALEKPRLHIEKRTDGRFNFSDLGGESAAGPSEKIAPPLEQGAGGGPLDLRVASFTLRNGEVDYRDASVKPALQHRLSRLQVTVHGFSLRERFPAELNADWNGNAIGLAGEFDLDDLATTATLTFNRLTLRASGDLLPEAKGERLRARLELPRISLVDLAGSLPKEYLSLPDGVVPGGELALSAELDGLLTEPLAMLRSARLELFAASVRRGTLQPALTGKLLLEGRTLSTDGLKLGLGGESVALALNSPDLLATPCALAVRLTGDRLDLDRALPKTATDAASADAAAAAQGDDEIGPLAIPLQLTAEVTIDEALVSGLSLRPLQLQLTLRDNVLRLEELKAGIGDDGQLVVTTRVDLRQKGLKYDGTLASTALQVNPLVQAFKPSLGNSLYGVVDGKVDFSGRGTTPASIKKQLTANGSLTLKEGRLKALPVLDATAALLGVPSLKEASLDEGLVTFRLRDGKVLLDAQTGGSKLRSAINGSVSLDGDLDLAVAVGLGPELSQQLDRRGALGRVLNDAQGWTTVPLKVSGRTDKPKVVPDSEALAKQAAGKALDRLGKSLQKKLAPGNDDKSSSEKQGVEAVLKGLLGR